MADKCEGTTKADKPCSRNATDGKRFCAQHADQEQVDLTVVASVKRDLAEIADRDPALAQSGLAATALSLAREMDGDNSATSKSMCARSLADVLDRLRALAPEKKEANRVDDLAKQRDARRQRSAAA